jgi:hypothetical protein
MFTILHILEIPKERGVSFIALKAQKTEAETQGV